MIMLESMVELSVSSYWSRPHSSHPRKKRRRKPVLKLLLKKLKPRGRLLLQKLKLNLIRKLGKSRRE